VRWRKSKIRIPHPFGVLVYRRQALKDVAI
jgi:hypothetical protein